MLVLSSSDVRRALSMKDCTTIIRRALIALSEGGIEVAERIQLTTGDGISLVMPAVWPDVGVMSTKLISVHANNPARGLPTSHGLVVLVQAETGRPLALLDANTLTALRTSAVVANALDALWPGEAPVVTLFGTGKHARYQLEALLCVRRPREIRVVGFRPEDAHEFARDMIVAPYLSGIPMRVLESVDDSVRDADVILCATTSPTPVFDGSLVKPGAHVSAIGAFTPTTRELDSTLIERARIVVDSVEGAREEAGDLLIPLSEGRIDAAHFDRELGHVLAGTTLGRQSPDDITVFKSVGSAAFDIAAATAAADTARRLGVGQEIEID